MTGKFIRAEPAGPADRPEVERLLQEHLRELADYRAEPACDTSAYPYLDLYWTEPDRHAFWTKVLRNIRGAEPEWREGDGRRWSGPIVRFRSTGQA